MCRYHVCVCVGTYTHTHTHTHTRVHTCVCMCVCMCVCVCEYMCAVCVSFVHVRSEGLLATLFELMFT